MPSQAVQLRALVRAVELFGEPEKLTARLGISVQELTSMLQGASPVTEDVFLHAVDLLAANAQSGAIQARNFNWLPVEAFKRLTSTEKTAYLRQLAIDLDADGSRNA